MSVSPRNYLLCWIEAHAGKPGNPSKCQLYSGYHVSFDGKLGVSEAWKSTEGIGYYVGFDKETIGGWFAEGRVMTREELAMCNPLDARGEPTYILGLYELDQEWPKEIFNPPEKSDSQWLSAHKEAVKRSGTTLDNWSEEDVLSCLHQSLTDVLQEKGYDGILIEDWGVEFLPLRERLKLPGCKNRLNGLEFRK